MFRKYIILFFITIFCVFLNASGKDVWGSKWVVIGGIESQIEEDLKQKHPVSAETQKQLEEYDLKVRLQQKLPHKQKKKAFEVGNNLYSYKEILEWGQLRSCIGNAHINLIPVNIQCAPSILLNTRTQFLDFCQLMENAQRLPHTIFQRMFLIGDCLYSHHEITKNKALKRALQRAYEELICQSILIYEPGILVVQKAFLAYEAELKAFEKALLEQSKKTKSRSKNKPDPKSTLIVPVPKNLKTFKIGRHHFTYEEIMKDYRLELALRNAHIPTLPNDVFKLIMRQLFYKPITLRTPDDLRDFVRIYGEKPWHLKGMEDPLAHQSKRNPLRLKHPYVILEGGHWLKPRLPLFASAHIWEDIGGLVLDHNRWGSRFNQFEINETEQQVIPCKVLSFTTNQNPLYPDHPPFYRYICPNLESLYIDNIRPTPTDLSHLAMINLGVNTITFSQVYANGANPIEHDTITSFCELFEKPVNFVFQSCPFLTFNILKAFTKSKKVGSLTVEDCLFISSQSFATLTKDIVSKRGVVEASFEGLAPKNQLLRGRTSLKLTDGSLFNFQGRLIGETITADTDAFLGDPSTLKSLSVGGTSPKMDLEYWTKLFGQMVNLKHLRFSYLGCEKKKFHALLEAIFTHKTLQSLDLDRIFNGTLTLLKKHAGKGSLRQVTLRGISADKGKLNFVEPFDIRDLSRDLKSFTIHPTKGDYTKFSIPLKNSGIRVIQ